MTDLMSDMYTEGEFLEQAGVKGMKWGVRKKRTTNNVHTSADAARYNKIRTRVKKNGLDNLSNDDLAKLNKRAQLLSEYKKNNPSKFKQGHEAVKSALSVVSTADSVITKGTKVVNNPIVRNLVSTIVKNIK